MWTIKCDRCGKIYNPNSGKNKGILPMVFDSEKEVYIPFVDTPIELCPKCVHEFSDWFCKS